MSVRIACFQTIQGVQCMNFAYAAGFHFFMIFTRFNGSYQPYPQSFPRRELVTSLLTWSSLHATTGQLSETHGAAGVGNLYRHRQR